MDIFKHKKPTRAQRYKMHMVNKNRVNRGLSALSMAELFMTLGENEQALQVTPNSNYPFDLYNPTFKNNNNIVNLNNPSFADLNRSGVAEREILKKNRADIKILPFNVPPLTTVNLLRRDYERSYLFIRLNDNTAPTLYVLFRYIESAGEVAAFSDAIPYNNVTTKNTTPLEFNQVIPINAISLQNIDAAVTINGFIMWA